MSVKTSPVASHCPQCGCAVLPCPSCGKLLKEGMVLCVSCGYHLQLGRHVGTSPNGAHGAANPAAPHANGHIPVSTAKTQDYIASLLGSHAPSPPPSPTGKPTAATVASGNAAVGNVQNPERPSKFAWLSWLTFRKRKALATPQTFTRPQPGKPPQPVSRAVVHVGFAAKESQKQETDIGPFLIPTALLVVGLVGIGWFAWSKAGLPGVVIAPSLLLTVLLLGTIWNAAIMHLAGWLLEFDFGPVGLGLYRLFVHSVFTTGLALATAPLANLTGIHIAVWAVAVPIVSFAMFSALFELEWFDAMVVYAAMVFVAAVFQFFAFGLLHTGNYVKFNFGGPQEEVAPRQGVREDSGEDEDDDGESPPVRASDPGIRNPQPATPTQNSSDSNSKADATKSSEPPKMEPPKTESSKTDNSKLEPAKENPPMPVDAGPPSKED